MTRFRIFLAVLLAAVFSGGVSSLAQADECAPCQKRTTPGVPLVSMNRISCDSPTDPASFDVAWCASFGWFVDADDFFNRLKRCAPKDPKGRTSSVDILTSITCRPLFMTMVRPLSESDIPLSNRASLSAPSALLLSAEAGTRAATFLQNLVKEYQDRGKKDGYKDLKKFVATLNRPDGNGLSFLDTVMVRFSEQAIREHPDERTIRDQLIKSMCSVGARFAHPDQWGQIACEADETYIR